MSILLQLYLFTIYVIFSYICVISGFTGPIIGITGNAMQEDHDIFMDAGASKVLTKPLSINLLWDALKDMEDEEEEEEMKE